VSGFSLASAGPGRLAASGDLEFATAADALAAGLKLITAGQSLVVDLRGVTAGDSAGLAVLVEWLSVARERNARLSYQSVPPQILALARTSGLEELLLVQPG
jgi:phospholipid transport system transporter-binding protein